MKVKVETTRECCQPMDLKPIEGTRYFGRFPQFMFCVHCGRHLTRRAFTDVAGASDQEFVVRLPRPGMETDPTAGGVKWPDR